MPDSLLMCGPSSFTRLASMDDIHVVTFSLKSSMTAPETIFFCRPQRKSDRSSTTVVLITVWNDFSPWLGTDRMVGIMRISDAT